MTQKTSSFFICLFSVFVFFKGEILESEASEVNLPKTIGVWTRPETPQTINSKNIFEYMNGAGELYLGYRFRHLEALEYTSQQEANILVELYFMETSDDAFGLLSLDWGGEIVSFGSNTEDGSHPSPDSSIRALYGAGLLRLWSDDLYVRVMSFRETPASKKAVLALGETIAANRRNPPEPQLLRALSAQIDSSWTLRRDRLSFFRSYLALNSIYYLSHENILDLDLSTEAVMATYEHMAGSGEPRRSRFLVVQHENHERAQRALNHFHDAYLPEHQEVFTTDLADKSLRLFKIEDGWLAYRLAGNYVAIVFECPDVGTARTIIEENESNLQK
jgi:hypothetical protein